jgi:tyrosyl-tRNA synthetase
VLAREIPTTTIPASEIEAGLDPIGAFVSAGLARSKGEVRRNLPGHYVNGQAIGGLDPIGPSDLLHGRFVLLRRGKASHALLIVTSG